MLHGFQTAVFCLTLFVKEILPISTVVQCSKRGAFTAKKKEEKQLSWSNSPVFLKHKMPVVEKKGEEER